MEYERRQELTEQLIAGPDSLEIEELKELLEANPHETAWLIASEAIRRLERMEENESAKDHGGEYN